MPTDARDAVMPQACGACPAGEFELAVLYPPLRFILYVLCPAPLVLFKS